MKAVMGARGTQFRYGVHDCCMFAADLSKAITGHDPLGKVRSYVGRAEMEAVISEHGGVLEDAIVDEMEASGFPEIPVADVAQGDNILLKGKHGHALGSVADVEAKTVIIAASRGWVTIPIDQAVRAWKVG